MGKLHRQKGLSKWAYALGLVCLTSSIWGQYASSTWVGSMSGEWTSAINWAGNTVALGPSEQATFPSVGTVPITVTLGGVINIGTVRSESTTGGTTYTIGSSTSDGSLQMGGNSYPGFIQIFPVSTASAANLTINSPITLSSALTLLTSNATNAPVITLNGAITGTGSSVITISPNTTVLFTAASTALASPIGLGSGAILQVADNALLGITGTAGTISTTETSSTIEMLDNGSAPYGLILYNDINVVTGTTLSFNIYSSSASASDTLQLSGTLSGSGIIEQTSTLGGAGGGVLQFAHNNSGFSGSILVTSGTISATEDYAFGPAGTMVTLNGGAIKLADGVTPTIPVTIDVISGSGIESFGNSATFSGPITGSSPVFYVGSNQLTGNPVTFTSPGITYGGTIQTNGAGGPTLVIAPSGATSVSYSIMIGSSYLPTPAVILGSTSGALTISGTISETMSNYRLSSIETASGSDTVTLTGNSNYAGGVIVNGTQLNLNPASSATYSGAFSGSGPVGIGAGTVILSGDNNSFSGGFTVSSTLQVQGANSLGSSSNVVTVDTGGLLQLGSHASGGSRISLQGGTLQTVAGLSNFSTNIAVATNASTIDMNGLSSRFSGVLSSSGPQLTIINSQAGPSPSATLTLTGTNTDLANLQLTSGILAVSAADNLGNNGNTILLNGGTLSTTATMTLLNSPIQITASSALQQNSGTTFTISSLISMGAGLTLNQNGPGTLAITNLANSFSSAIALNGGLLQSNGHTTLGSGRITINQATLQPIGSSADITNSVVINNAGSTIDLSQIADTTATISGLITGTGTLNLTGPSTNILSLSNGGNSGAWGVTLQGGILSLTSANIGSGTGTITFDGGALQTAGAGLTIPNSVSITSGVLDLDGNANETFSGAFTGSGTLNVSSSIVSGTPTLNLTNSTGGNSFSGTVVLNNPTALNVAPTATTAISYGITAASSNTNGLALSFAPAGGTILTVNGAISGPTAVAVNSGTVAMSSGLANTYTGSSFINNGTLQINSPSNVSSGGNIAFGGSSPILALGSNWGAVGGTTIPNTLLASAAATFNLGGQTATLTGGIDLTAAGLTLNGRGTLILNPSSSGSYSGTNALTISSGTTLQSDVAAAPPVIANNGTLRFQLGGGVAGTYGGTVTGAGILEVGSGTLTLQGGSVTLTGSGGVGILSGATLAVNETVTANMLVKSGGLLQGTGTIVGMVQNKGTISPGNSPGTLTIMGSYVQASGSTFDLDFGSSTSFSLLQVQAPLGTVGISSNTTLMMELDPSTLILPSEGLYTFITSTGGVTGTFSNIIFPGPLFEGFLVYPGNSVSLALITVPINDIVVGGNAGSVAKCIAHLAAESLAAGVTTPTDVLTVLKALAYANHAGTLRSNLEQFQPALFSGFTVAQQEASIKVLNALAQAGDLWDKNRCAVEWREDHTVRGWFQPFGEFTQQNATGSEQIGFSSTTGGIVGGADYKLPCNFYLGAGAAYTYSDVDFHHHRGDGSIRSYYGGLYSSWMTNFFFAELAVLGAYNNYHGNRNIRVNNNPAFVLNRTASHSQGGYEVAGHIGGGALFQNSRGTQFTPFVSFDYIFLHQNSYQEYGAQSLDLSVREKRANYLRAVGGFTLSQCFTIRGGKLVPDLKLSYVREERMNGAATEAGIPSTNNGLGQCFFTVKGINPSRNVFAPGVGLSWLSKEMHYSVTARYNGEFSNHYMDNEATLQVGFNF